MDITYYLIKMIKKLSIFPAIAIFVAFSCNNSTKKNSVPAQGEVSHEVAYKSYGAQHSGNNSSTPGEMFEIYNSLKPGDTVDVSFKSTVKSVCKNKGCWMTVDLTEDEEVMVKFKDYGFFVPKDIEEKEVIVKGKAFVAEVSVEEQQHYAEDNGQTEAEVAAIKEPKRTLSFLADGVLIKE